MQLEDTVIQNLQYDRRNEKYDRILIMSDGDKGGPAKSFNLRAAAHALTTHGYHLRGCDGDLRNAHLERYMSASFEVTRTPLRQEEGWGEMMRVIASTPPGTVVLCDLPGGIGDMLANQMPRLSVTLNRHRAGVIRLWALNKADDVIMQLSQSRQVIGYADTIAVKGGIFGSADEFELWGDSKTRKAFLAEGGKETYLGRLAPKVDARIMVARCSFAAALQLDLEEDELTDLEMWLGSLDTTFAPLLARLKGQLR